jgi:hypothetical protein
MRVVVACLWVVAAACSFDPATVDGGGGGGGGGSGGGSDQSCFAGSSDFAFCIATPTQPITLATSGMSFDTGAAGKQDGCTLGTYVMVGSAEACVIAGTTVTIAAQTSFVAVDAYPLVIAATGDVDIAGLLDVSTPSGGQHGAGFNATECSDTGIDGGSYKFGASGGAGGSFSTPGGAGGNGAEDDRGVAQPAVSATRLRGGCRGGTGGSGNGTPPAPGGNAGYGGGAVLVVAYGGIAVSGAIDASGERGYPGQTQGGGGAGGSGGASGGMIVLAATSYDITGALVANGGGGGGGGGENGDEGEPGMGGIASIASPSQAASGGSGAGEGGAGGTGAAGSAAAMAGVSSTANGGGGGGGGGDGVIGYLGGTFPPPASNVSPPAISL